MAGMNLGTAQGQIKINTSDLKNADIALRSAGTSMINLGTQAVGAFAAIVGEAAKFEKEMDFVAAITNASSDEMDQLKQAAIEMGKKSIFGPVELSKAFVELVKAGASAEQIIDGVGQASVNLATAADVEIPFAGENLINIMNTFRLGAEDATMVVDQLAGAANASSVDLQDIVTTMRYAGPVAEALGLSFQETNQALSILGKVGIKGSTAGTSLRFMMTHLIPATEKASDAMTSIGLTVGEDGLVKEFTAADGSLIGLAESMEILSKATEGMGEQAKVKVIQDIFGVRAMPTVLELMNLGAEGFENLRQEIERTTAADVAAQRMDNLDGSIKRLKATLSAIMIDAGGPFQTMVKGWVDGLRDLLLWFDALPRPLKNFIVGGIGAFGVLSLMAGGFLLTVGNMVRAIRVMGEIGNAFAVLGGGISKVAKANGLLNLSLLASPWFWLAVLIIAVIAAIVLLWIKCEAFRDFVKDFWEDMKGWGKAIADFFTKAWDAVVAFFEDWEKHWDTVKKSVDKAWEAVKGFFGDVGEAISNFVGSIATWFTEELWDPMVNGILGAGQAVLDFFTGLPGMAMTALTSLVTLFTDNIGKLPGALGYAIGFMIGRWIRLWIDIAQFTITWIGNVLGYLQTWGGQVVGWVQEFAVNFVTTLINWFQQLPGMIAGIFVNIAMWLVNWGTSAISWGITFGGNLFNTLRGWISQIPGMVIGFFADILSYLWDNADNFFAAAWDIGTNLYNGVINFITGLPARVWGIFNDGINMVRNMATAAWNAAQDFGEGLWEGFKDGIGIGSPSHIERALMAVQDQAWATEGNLVRSIRSMNGLSATIPVNTGAVGLSTPQAAAASGGLGLTVNGPLLAVDKMTGTETEVLDISRKLAGLTYKQLEAQGNRAARVNGAMNANG